MNLRFQSDIAMLDDALVEELLDRFDEAGNVTPLVVVNFLLAEGIVRDGAEARAVCERWVSAGLVSRLQLKAERRTMSTRTAPLAPSGGQLGGQRGERRDSGSTIASRRSGASDESNRTSVTRREQRLLCESEVVRRSMQMRFPGLQREESEEMPASAALVHGDSVVLHASGMWVARRRTPASMRKWMGLKLVAKEAMAEKFHIATSEAYSLEMVDDDRQEGVVYFGDYVWLQNARGTTWVVQFACPGKSGPVLRGDMCFIVQNDPHDKEDGSLAKASWGFGRKQRLDGSVSLKLNAARSGDGARMAPACFAVLPLHSHRPRVVSQSPAASRTPGGPVASLSVLTYDVWMLPSPVAMVLRALYRTPIRKTKRAELIPTSLRRAFESEFASERMPDVAIICGANCYEATPVLKAGLKRELGMHFETVPLGSRPGSCRVTNGGVVVMSKYPILGTKQYVFGKAAAGHDSLANKGAVYVCLNVSGKHVHVVGTHLQSGSTRKDTVVRQHQLLATREFLQSLRIPSSDLVLFAGNLNVCRVGAPEEYERMMDILGARDPATPLSKGLLQDAQANLTPRVNFDSVPYDSADAGAGAGPNLGAPAGEPTKVVASQGRRKGTVNRSGSMVCFVDTQIDDIFTVNPHKNKLVGSQRFAQPVAATLDYVLYSRHHRAPLRAVSQVLHNFRASAPYEYRKGDCSFEDLSPHYPVLAHFDF